MHTFTYPSFLTQSLHPHTPFSLTLTCSHTLCTHKPKHLHSHVFLLLTHISCFPDPVQPHQEETKTEIGASVYLSQCYQTCQSVSSTFHCFSSSNPEGQNCKSQERNSVPRERLQIPSDTCHTYNLVFISVH